MSDLMCAVRVFCVRRAAVDPDAPTGVDTPLSASGREQARRTGEQLAAERVAVVYTSPLCRARETAELVAEAVGARVLVEDGLTESAGDGETDSDMVARMSGVLESVSDLHRGETVVLVSHAAPLSRGVTALCPELRPPWVERHPLAEAATVDLGYDDGGWRCRRWGDSHC